MNKIVAKIYLWSSFSYFMSFVFSFFILKSTILTFLSPIWLLFIAFLCLLTETYFAINIFPNAQNLEPNHAILYLILQSFLLALFMIVLPLLHPNLAFDVTSFFLLSLVFLFVGILGLIFKINVSNTFFACIIVLISLFGSMISSTCLHTLIYGSATVNDEVIAGIFGTFLSMFSIAGINKIKNELRNGESTQEKAPNYAFITVFGLLFILLTISKTFLSTKTLDSNDASNE